MHIEKDYKRQVVQIMEKLNSFYKIASRTDSVGYLPSKRYLWLFAESYLLSERYLYTETSSMRVGISTPILEVS